MTIGGKSVKFSTKRLTSLSEIANKITQVMNEAREEVNKNRTSSKLNKKDNQNKPSLVEWRKNNPGGSVTEWKKDTGR